MILSAPLGGLDIAIYHEEFSCWCPNYFTKLAVEVKMNESGRTREIEKFGAELGIQCGILEKDLSLAQPALLKNTKEPNRKGLFFLAGQITRA